MLIDFKQLFPKYGLHPTGVLQVGSNDAHDELKLYADLGFKRQFFIEADPVSFERLKLNVENSNSNVLTDMVNVCASDENDKEIDFNISSNNGESSSVLELGNHKVVHPEVTYVNKIKVKTKRIDSLSIPAELDFLNVDVQGYELQVLKGMGEVINQFRSAYLEINSKETYIGCALLPQIDAFMQSKGFRRAEIFNPGNFLERLGWSDAFYIK